MVPINDITRYRPAVSSKNPTINKNITTCILTYTQKSSVNIIVCKLCWMIDLVFAAYTCEPGHYVDVGSKTLECKVCPKGTYSVGGGVRFSKWDQLPTGFESRISDEHYEGYGYDDEYFHQTKSGNCSKWVCFLGGWGELCVYRAQDCNSLVANSTKNWVLVAKF